MISSAPHEFSVPGLSRVVQRVLISSLFGPTSAKALNVLASGGIWGKNEMLPAHKRPQSFEEEIANGVSHGIALVACLIATPFLLISVARPGDAWNVAGAAIFAGAKIFMYLSSALYHVLPENRAKRVFSSA